MKVSVVMPAFNAEEFIEEAIDSVLNQTFKDFEFIIIDDSSTDSTSAIIKKYQAKDGRIIYVTNKHAKGVTGALNTGLEIAKGEYIVRMDTDDISLPERLKTQVQFMDEHKEIGLAGSWYELMGSKTGIKELPTDNKLIKCTMLLHGALAHPTVIFRRKLFEDYNLNYNPKYVYGQDLDLWIRASKITEITNIPEVLIKYRIYDKNVGSSHSAEQSRNARNIRKEELMNLGIYPTYEEMEIHHSLSNWNYADNSNFLINALGWIQKIIGYNHEKKLYDEKTLIKFLYSEWINAASINERKNKKLATLFKEIKNIVKSEALRYESIGEELSKKFYKEEEFYNFESPKISVVMASYNAEKYIRESIESILNQTFKNFEFLIINDSSTDSTESIILEYTAKDERVKLLNNKYSKGIAGAANTGLESAKGEYIARMDSDDISLPIRFEEEVRFLDSNPEFGVCGAWVKTFGSRSTDAIWESPVDPEYIKCIMIFYGAISNPVVMIRKKVLDENNLSYRNTPAEDYDLYVRLAKVTKLTNIPKVLLKYRMHETNFGNIYLKQQSESTNTVRLAILEDLGIEPTEEEKSIHIRVGFWDLDQNREFLAKAENWFRKLINANNEKKIYPEPMFSMIMVEKWFDAYNASQYLATIILIKFFLKGMFSTAPETYRLRYAARILRVYLKRILKKIRIIK